MNLTCVICSDLFMPSDDVHMTPCGHAFHYACLLQWLERSKSCPQCRNKCHEKSLIKVYFNIAASIDLPEDNAALVHKLDNLTLAVREKDKKIKEYEDKDTSQKEERKKMKKTIKALEDKVHKKNFAISSFEQELTMLRSDRCHMLELQAKVKELTSKLDLMSTIEHVITATASEVEEMLARDNNAKTLAVLVASLKRELKGSDAKNNELRERMNSIRSDLQAERSKRKDLEDKLSTAESELYQLEQEVLQLKKNVLDTSNKDSDTDSVILNTPEQVSKRKRPASDKNESPSMSQKVQNILSSDSPYFSIKSSSLGLAPLLRPGVLTAGTGKADDKANPPQNKLSEKFSILRKPRLLLKPSSSSKNMVYNGLGGSEKKENFPGFPWPKETKATAVATADGKNSTKARLKAGKLSRQPSASSFATNKVTSEEAKGKIRPLIRPAAFANMTDTEEKPAKKCPVAGGSESKATGKEITHQVNHSDCGQDGC